MYPKILPEVRGGAQRAEGAVVEGKLLYYCLKKGEITFATLGKVISPFFCLLVVIPLLLPRVAGRCQQFHRVGFSVSNPLWRVLILEKYRHPYQAHKLAR